MSFPKHVPAAPAAEDPRLLEEAALDREEEEFVRLKLALPSWLEGNPGLTLTVLYLFASVVGMVFHFLLLRRFGFNVLEFSETSDFLMVVAREPLTVALALLGVPFYLVYMTAAMRVGRWARPHVAALRSTPEKRRKAMASMRRWRYLLQTAFFGVWALVFVMSYSSWRASRIRAGEFRAVSVYYKTDSPRADGTFAVQGVALLGTTSKFVFLYDATTKRAEVVPLDAIARLVWDARTRREREADAKPVPAGPAQAAATGA
jgi:hypothetical protein